MSCMVAQRSGRFRKYWKMFLWPLFNAATSPSEPRPPHYGSFTITLSRDLYLTTHNTHKTQTSMPTAGVEPAIPASERPHTHALDRAATGVGDPVMIRFCVHSGSVTSCGRMSICLFLLAMCSIMMTRHSITRKISGYQIKPRSFIILP